LAQQGTVIIRAVGNKAMIELKKLSIKFEAQNPKIRLSGVVVEGDVFAQAGELPVARIKKLPFLKYVNCYFDNFVKIRVKHYMPLTPISSKRNQKNAYNL
jgi:hypothetical protein